MIDLLYVKPMAKISTGIGVCLVILIQVIIGTQVREQVDIVAKSMGEAQRAQWLANLPTIFSVHKTFYYLVAASVMYWVWMLNKKSSNIIKTTSDNLFKPSLIHLFSTILLTILIAEIALGISMSKLGMPPVLQPLHLLFGSIMFATAFTITGILYYKKGKY